MWQIHLNLDTAAGLVGMEAHVDSRDLLFGRRKWELMARGDSVVCTVFAPVL
jgi:hypothetical protein